MRTARLDYRPGATPAPVGFHKPKQDTPTPTDGAETRMSHGPRRSQCKSGVVRIGRGERCANWMQSLEVWGDD
jgi:hypothetical protein